MVKITFQMIVFNGDAFLEPVLEAIKPFGEIVVTEGPVEYYQRLGFSTSTDCTNEILKRYVPERNIVHGQWQEKNEMMRAAEALIPKGTTHVWMVDADEVWSSETLQMMLYTLEDFDSVSFRPYSFYGGFSRYLTGFEESFEWIRVQRWRPDAHWHTHRPPTVLAPDGRPYRKHRHLASTQRFYHYSYVLPEQVRSKIAYYESWGAGVIPNYFDLIYLPWVTARSGYARRTIEEQHQGVHEWLPERRGDCFTEEFRGAHPRGIAQRLPLLQRRLEAEVRQCLAV